MKDLIYIVKMIVIFMFLPPVIAGCVTYLVSLILGFDMNSDVSMKTYSWLCFGGYLVSLGISYRKFQVE